MIDRHLPRPRYIAIFRRIERVGMPASYVVIELVSRGTVLALPVTVTGVGCVRDRPFSVFDVGSLHRRDELPRRYYMSRF